MWLCVDRMVCVWCVVICARLFVISCRWMCCCLLCIVDLLCLLFVCVDMCCLVNVFVDCFLWLECCSVLSVVFARPFVVFCLLLVVCVLLFVVCS